MIEGLIAAIVITMAVKWAAERASAHWQGSKAANRRSTKGKSIPKRAASAVHHDLGYWAHQVLNLFPEVRHGLAEGWHEGRKAQAQGAAGRQERKTERLESRAGIIEKAREHAKRQREAQERIRRARQPEPDEETDGGDDPAREPSPPDAGSGEGTPEGTSEGTSPATGTAGSEQDPENEAQQEPPRHCGCSRLISGGKCMGCGRHPAVCTCSKKDDENQEQDTPGEKKPPAQPGQGDGNVSETTYQGVKQQMETAAAEAEQYAGEAEQAETVTEEHSEQARQAKEQGQVAAEEMQALEVDAETLSAMADHLQALDDAEKRAAELNDQTTQLKEAWQRVQETAAQVQSQLDASGHGALDEAHANAAAGGGKKEFYGEGS